MSIATASRAASGRVEYEWRLLTSLPARRLRVAGPRAIPATIASVLLIVAFSALSHTDIGWRFVNDVAGIYGALSLPLVLVRLPLSMFAPAPDLPAWGALAQVLVVFGLAEIWLGWRRMLSVAVLTSAATTLVSRLFIIMGFHLHIGLPQTDAYVLDTGPSVAVVALLAYVTWQRRAYLAFAITVASMAGEAILLPNLAGREHLVAITLGMISFVLFEHAFPGARQRWVRWRHPRPGQAIPPHPDAPALRSRGPARPQDPASTR